MFTGIIETLGQVVEKKPHGGNLHFAIKSAFGRELKVDQSVAHNGVCLTVISVESDTHWVTAIGETLKKSNLGSLSPGDKVNLERSMLNNGRFDGHIVQGHVDQLGVLRSIREENGSWVFTFGHEAVAGNVTVEKGSIAVNGVSLTCFDSTPDSFSVAIIPYTFEHTNFQQLRTGDRVNLEFDIIGKYVRKLLSPGV